LYAGTIVRAINSTSILIVILSVHSTGSQSVLREVELASARRRPMVTVRLDTTPLPAGLEYYLSASHWLDASAAPIDLALPHLLNALRRLQASVENLGNSDFNAVGQRGTTTSHAAPKKSHRVWMMAALAAIAIIGVALWPANRSRMASAPGLTATVSSEEPRAAPSVFSNKSIAVLPFVDMGETKDQEYFADGG
jgi:hypothetical protein